jgi:hypothetical protein
MDRVSTRRWRALRVAAVAALVVGASHAVAGAMGWDGVLVVSSDTVETPEAVSRDGSPDDETSTPDSTIPGEAPVDAPTDGDGSRADVPRSPARILDVEAPSSVQPGDDLVVRWRLSTPGETETWMYVGGPSGWVTWCGFPTYGVPRGGEGDVVYEARCSLPERLPNGVLSVFIDAIDVEFGDEVSIDVAVVGGSEDDDAPVVSDVEIDSSTPGPGDEIRVRWRATDETGTASVIPWVVGPNGFMVDSASRPWATYQPGTLESGTPIDGEYSAVLRLSDSAMSGQYWIWFSTLDTLGNKLANFTPSVRFSLR